MAIFGIGAYYDEDVSDSFISGNIAGPGWDCTKAPELHQFIRSLKVGDIVYLKSFSPTSPDIFVKAIGVVADEIIITNSPLVATGRNIKWLVTEQFRIPKPKEKNNVRFNTMYEEFHPSVQSSILGRLFNNQPTKQPE
ncbi:hypothetical protein QSH18_16945 [Xanthomonas sp. NCPPB 2654]|uniref:hypothetical protein n=1 Tax=unclassified Xanthomonas TaxID=2643310 RepID=UPI0021DF9D87|nr:MULTISPECIES: hypothetical protein [unclassified Xanthomonas]MDL5367298.1 hypothetical protein [Xanthomonas sp. NCPPB 2654]UYC19580.1 hypothetical protein NUG20_15535 [Xanthomonas sp. CFBP 8443]